MSRSDCKIPLELADEALNTTVPVRPTPHCVEARSGTDTAIRYAPDESGVGWIARLSGGAALPDIRTIVPLYMPDWAKKRNCALSPMRK